MMHIKTERFSGNIVSHTTHSHIQFLLVRTVTHPFCSFFADVDWHFHATLGVERATLAACELSQNIQHGNQRTSVAFSAVIDNQS